MASDSTEQVAKKLSYDDPDRVDDANRRTENILVVGLVTECTTSTLQSDAQKRDFFRIRALRERFGSGSVFSLARAKSFDIQYHVSSFLNRIGGYDLGLLMKTKHAKKQLHYICVEYVRGPGAYCNGIVVGDRQMTHPGMQFVNFVKELQKVNAITLVVVSCLRVSKKRKSPGGLLP